VPAFLFTDIEGSTSRWERDPTAMQAALRRHDVAVRTAVEARGGDVFKALGDAFCVAFDSVTDAISAAVAAQRAVLEEHWDDIGGLAVRMAVHSGEAERRDGDFFGPPLNRVARMLGHGHGGQIVVSGTAAEMASGLEPGMTFRNLGTIALRGVPIPERLYQLCVPGLRDDFPPLHAAADPPTNFPLQPTALIGRAVDRAMVADAIGAGRLITVEGPGGIGKTRLALAAASDVRAEYPDGAWFVDFAPLRDEELVESAVLTTLGARNAGSSSSADALIDFLRKRRTLLVFDNCEHVVAVAARLASALLTHCPNVALVATSRSPLRVNGEREIRLTSLDGASGAALFAERAQNVRPDFTLDGKTRPLVVELCRKLDGMPLAIELAAARMRVLSLEELTRRLTLRALSTNARDRDPRQQTMNALIDWSYELLDPRERRTFRAVSVFAGGFSLDAACAVDGELDDWATLDVLQSLTEKSLIVADVSVDSQRFRLMESIREFARERLAADGEEAATLERHARAFREFADRAYVEWDTDPSDGWLARCTLELDNLRAALECFFADRRRIEGGAELAASVAPIFMRLSLLREGVAWCERALERVGELTDRTAARLNYAVSMLFHNLGMDERALECARRAAEAYERVGDDRGLTRALSQVAYEAATTRNLPAAIVAAQDALSKARSSGDRRLLAATLQRCAIVTESTDMSLTRKRYSEAINIFRSLGRKDEMARAMLWWADAEGVAGNTEAAVTIANEALEICPLDLRLFLTNGLAGWYVALDHRANAFKLARESLKLASDLRHDVVQLGAILYLAALSPPELAETCARFAGYIGVQCRRLNWTFAPFDEVIACNLRDNIRRTIGDVAYELGVLEGSNWSEEQAVAFALQL
jgi:predicted ATPase/class 3 adenylate cyclase